MTNDRVAKSYIWHNEQCYFVSTIERDSSAMLGPRRYNETMVWEFDWTKNERGSLIYQGECNTNSIFTHQKTVDTLYKGGKELLIED